MFQKYYVTHPFVSTTSRKASAPHKIDLQDSTNCAHNDEHVHNVPRNEALMCMKLRAHKSIKTLSSSTQMLLKLFLCLKASNIQHNKI